MKQSSSQSLQPRRTDTCSRQKASRVGELAQVCFWEKKRSHGNRPGQRFRRSRVAPLPASPRLPGSGPQGADTWRAAGMRPGGAARGGGRARLPLLGVLLVQGERGGLGPTSGGWGGQSRGSGSGGLRKAPRFGAGRKGARVRVRASCHRQPRGSAGCPGPRPAGTVRSGGGGPAGAAGPGSDGERVLARCFVRRFVADAGLLVVLLLAGDRQSP